jgi:hypothetical protein
MAMAMAVNAVMIFMRFPHVYDWRLAQKLEGLGLTPQ